MHLCEADAMAGLTVQRQNLNQRWQTNVSECIKNNINEGWNAHLWHATEYVATKQRPWCSAAIIQPKLTLLLLSSWTATDSSSFLSLPSTATFSSCSFCLACSSCSSLQVAITASAYHQLQDHQRIKVTARMKPFIDTQLRTIQHNDNCQPTWM